MSDSNNKSADQKKFSEKVQQSTRRKLKAEQQKNGSAWFGLGMFGLIGWSISVPSLVGIAIGLWLDKRWPSDASWALTLLIIGIGIGCLNAWYWVKQESDND